MGSLWRGEWQRAPHGGESWRSLAWVSARLPPKVASVWCGKGREMRKGVTCGSHLLSMSSVSRCSIFSAYCGGGVGLDGI